MHKIAQLGKSISFTPSCQFKKKNILKIDYALEELVIKVTQFVILLEVKSRSLNENSLGKIITSTILG